MQLPKLKYGTTLLQNRYLLENICKPFTVLFTFRLVLISLLLIFMFHIFLTLMLSAGPVVSTSRMCGWDEILCYISNLSVFTGLYQFQINFSKFLKALYKVKAPYNLNLIYTLVGTV
jgi:hypothetical protein